MCLDSVNKSRSKLNAATIRVGYKWMNFNRKGRKKWLTPPIYTIGKRMYHNRWYSSKSRGRITRITTTALPNYDLYEPAFHIYLTKKEASTASLGAPRSLDRVLVKVMAREVVATGRQDGLRVFCARKMKIVKVY